MKCRFLVWIRPRHDEHTYKYRRNSIALDLAEHFARTRKNATASIFRVRIETSSDNAAYWSIATTMRSDNLAKSAVADSLGLGQAVLDTTYTGMDQVREELTAIRNLVLAASDLPPPPTDGTSNWLDYQSDEVYDGSAVARIDLEIGQRFKQIASIVGSSSFSGINLLKNEVSEPQLPGAQIEFVAGFAKGKVQTVALDMSATVMINYNRPGDVLDGGPGSEHQGFLDGIWFSNQTACPQNLDASAADYDSGEPVGRSTAVVQCKRHQRAFCSSLCRGFKVSAGPLAGPGTSRSRLP
jgi:hypothetical protein